jgi:hypothetical protein
VGAVSKTDHSYSITALRQVGKTEDMMAADLLELHDQTGISLDNWEVAKTFIRTRLATNGLPLFIEPNGV